MVVIGFIVAAILVLYYLYWQNSKDLKATKVGTDEQMAKVVTEVTDQIHKKHS